MGYACYALPDGRMAGYAVAAICDRDGCTEAIDRGLWFLCGDHPGDGGEHGCGGYFCGAHLFITPDPDLPQLCEDCVRLAFERAHQEPPGKSES